VLCFGGGETYVPAWFADLDAQLAAAPFPARRLGGPREALTLGSSYDAAIAPVAGGPILPATYAGMHARRKPFVLWASVWDHPRADAKARLAWPLIRHVYRNADAVVTYGPHVSAYVEQYRRGRGGRGPGDVVIAPQSVEPDVFGRDVSEHEIAAWRTEIGVPSGPIVLSVGRLVAEKGIHELLAGWRVLQQAGPNGATLVVVGDGPLRDDVAAQPGTILVGPTPREQLPVAYAAAEIVVVPSIPTPRFREPWGLVVNEALSQATPVVVTDAVGAAAGGLVKDRETGLVVRAGDAGALARALRDLTEHARLRQQLGEAGRAALAGYTYEQMADAFARALHHAGVKGISR